VSKSVSLVLGGGGARGVTHIGVIEVLEEMGYTIESVSGTSIGSIVGGVYAAGKLDEYKAWLLSLNSFDVAKLLDPTLSINGVIKGEKIMSRVREIVEDVQIENLPISYTAVATDIKHGKEVWFQKGSLVDAMRASMAIPNIFVPFKVDNRLYVDGGIVNPVPVTPTLSDQTDLTIAVSLNGASIEEVKREEEDGFLNKAMDFINRQIDTDDTMSYLEISSKSIDMMQDGIGRFKLASTPPDLVIEMPDNICGIFDFHHSAELIEYGRAEAKRVLEVAKL
jgi:NTE family protein